MSQSNVVRMNVPAAAVDDLDSPIIGPGLEEPDIRSIPHLARHRIPLSDGHMIGLTVAGRGVPLVVMHGFSAEGFLYAQSLSRLVAMGFKVIAIDTAGHGNTQGLPYDGRDLDAHAELLGRVLDELGIRQAVLAGHSMGGRIVTQLAAERPDRTIAVLLIDAIVGDTWDRMVYAFRVAPALLPLIGGALLADSISVLPLFRDPVQAAKLLRLVTPTIVRHAARPWRLALPMASILRSRSSRAALNELGEQSVPVFVMHGDRDLPVPHRTARQAAERAHGTLITVEGGGHSWLLRDPEALPGILAELLDDQLGHACRVALERGGLTMSSPTIDDIERTFYEPDSTIVALTPPDTQVRGSRRQRHRLRYRWQVESKPGVNRPRPVPRAG